MFTMGKTCISCHGYRNKILWEIPLSYIVMTPYFYFRFLKIRWRIAADSRMKLECMMISSKWRRSTTLDGIAASQDPLAWWRHFCRRKQKQQEGEEDRRSDEKTTSGIGFGGSLRAAVHREKWMGIVATRRPSRLRDWDEIWWDGICSCTIGPITLRKMIPMVICIYFNEKENFYYIVQ